jgi:hypothetical protein
MGKRFSKKRYRFSKEVQNELLDFILPQKFEHVTFAIQDALRQIDPSWEIGQFDVFSRHFRYPFFRSFFTQRLLLNNSKGIVVTEEKILEQILQTSKFLDDERKAAFYGAVHIEYILRCPEARFPDSADEYKYKANWIVVWNLHSNAWHNIYW